MRRRVYNNCFGNRSTCILLLCLLIASFQTSLAQAVRNGKDVTSFCDVLSLNGVHPVYDQFNDILLLSVSERMKSEHTCKLKVLCSPPSGMRLQFNGRDISSGDVVTLTNYNRGRKYRMTLRADTGVVAESNLVLTFMPVVELAGTDFSKEQFVVGTLRINDGDYPRNNDSLYAAAIRYRGNSTQWNQKKGYAVKLLGKKKQSLERSFHGMRTDNYWIFDPMSIDPARMRNPASLKLWSKFAKDCYYIAEEPNRRKASRGFFAEVVLNGTYIGIYDILEKSDRKQFKLKKVKGAGDAAVVHSVLYKAKERGTATVMAVGYKPGEFDNTQKIWEKWASVYPDIDKGQKTNWKPLYDAVNLVSTGSDKDFINKVWTHFEQAVMIDYFLLTELIQGYDNMGKNMLYMAYDIQKNNMLTVAPWDMDGTWGRNWYGGITDGQHPEKDIAVSFRALNGLYRRLFSIYPNWKEMEGRRYCELRGNYFRQDSLLAVFNDNFDLFAASAADKREEIRWDGKNNIHINFEEERAYLNDWIPRRLAALDKKYGYNASGIASVHNDELYSVEPAAHGLIFQTYAEATVDIYDVSGRLVRRMRLHVGRQTVDLPRGVYIVGKKKYSVR